MLESLLLVQGLGFRIWSYGLGIRVEGLGFGVEGLEFGCKVEG